MTEIRWSLRRFATVPSTNDWLLAEARAGAPAGTVVVADHQRAGKGRMGRRWEAPPGTSLLVSVLLRPVAPIDRLYAVTASAALAMADACAATAGAPVQVKWPNDLLVGERKLAGILAESDPAARGGRAGSVAVVVGAGCNVTWDGPAGATSLQAVSGRAVDRDALLEAYLGALGPRVALLDDDPGRRSVVDELRRRCATVGATVRVTTGAASVAAPERAGHGIASRAAPELTGVAEGIDDDGRLLIAHEGRVSAVAVGDVVHLRALAAPHSEPERRPERSTLPG